MSLFGKLFGGQSFEDERREADELFERGRFAEARQSYVRACDKGKSGSASALEHCQERVGECLDAMALARIAEAEELAEAGHYDLAMTELENAREAAQSEEIREKARRLSETLEKQDAVEQAALPEEVSDEDRWAILAGNWGEDQLEEYSDYEEPFRDALLALHDGRIPEARQALEELLEEHEEDAAYLWLEVGQARILDEDEEGGVEALGEFLDSLEDGAGGDARLAAHVALATICDRNDDEEGAIEEFQDAIDAMPDDPRPFLALGRYMRQKGHEGEAVEVLEAAEGLVDEDRPIWQLHQELGLALAAIGEDEKAAAALDKVIGLFVLRRHLDFPPETSMGLAALHEKAGRLDKAADLYRNLADGSDRQNHLLYHQEAGRLLLELGLDEEARRMYTRAVALAEDDEEARADIEAKLAELA